MVLSFKFVLYYGINVIIYHSTRKGFHWNFNILIFNFLMVGLALQQKHHAGMSIAMKRFS